MRLGERERSGRTVDHPGLYLRGLNLKCGRDDGVGNVAADVLEAEGSKGEKTDLTLQL